MQKQIPLLQEEICNLEEAVSMYQKADSMRIEQLSLCTDYAQDAEKEINSLNKKVTRLRRTSKISAIISIVLAFVCLIK